jgi:NAD(P)-dependent dehydrogenase (short-subunit alcohol dehydrogenase family)
VNTVNPDAVIEARRSGPPIGRRRASTYGIDAEISCVHRGRTRLGVDVYPEDVAEAVAFLAGPRSAKSTGNVINVDGGVTAAYPR